MCASGHAWTCVRARARAPPATEGQRAHARVCRWAESYERKAELRILCSIEPRATATAGAIADAIGGHRPEKRPTLAPLVFESRDSKASSFTKKFGESVTDLVARLEPIILEIEVRFRSSP